MYLLGFQLGEPPPPLPPLPFHVSKCSAASAYLSHNQRFSAQCPKHPFHCRHTKGLVPATSPGDHAPPCEMPCFTKISSRWDQNLLPTTSPTKSKWFKFAEHVPATCTRLKSLRVHCSWDQSPQSKENQPHGFVCLQNIASTWCSLECYLALIYYSKVLSKNKRTIFCWFDFQRW